MGAEVGDVVGADVVGSGVGLSDVGSGVDATGAVVGPFVGEEEGQGPLLLSEPTVQYCMSM